LFEVFEQIFNLHLMLLGFVTICFMQPTESLAQKPAVTIEEVFVDYDNEIIEIVGKNFNL